MGKETKSRSKRRNVTIQRRNKPPKSETNVKTVEGSVETLLKQLQMPNFEEKLCGLQTLGTLLENDEFLNIFIAQNVARIVAPLLIDENPTVRNTAAGTMRNFSAMSLEAAEYLVEQDVLTLMISFFQKYAQNWTPKKTKTGHLDEDSDTVLQCIYLLWNLCESSETAVGVIEKTNIIFDLIKFLDREKSGEELFVAVLHCVLVIIEDNQVLVNQFRESSYDFVQKLITEKGNEPVDLLIKSLCVGIFLSFHKDDLLNLPLSILSLLFQILSNTLDMDFRQGCNQISSHLPLSDEAMEETSFKNNTEVQQQITNLNFTADALQTAIEILTNICFIEDDSESMEVDENIDSNSDCEDIEDENCPIVSDDISLPERISNLILECDIFNKLCSKVNPLAENVNSILNESPQGKKIFMKLLTIQSKAMFCMNNFILNLSLPALGGCQTLFKVWLDTGKIIFKTDLSEIIHSSSMLMRASLNRLKKETQLTSNEELMKDITLADLEVMMNSINEIGNIDSKINMYKMIGDLATMLRSKSGDPNAFETALSQYLLEKLYAETEILVIAELLDMLIDLFSEDESDQLASKIGLIPKLEVVLPIFKKKAKNFKSRDPQFAAIDTVRSNLPRFIKYKKKMLNKM